MDRYEEVKRELYLLKKELEFERQIREAAEKRNNDLKQVTLKL